MRKIIALVACAFAVLAASLATSGPATAAAPASVKPAASQGAQLSEAQVKALVASVTSTPVRKLAESGEACRNTSYTDSALMARTCVDWDNNNGTDRWYQVLIKVFNVPLSQGGHSDYVGATAYNFAPCSVCSGWIADGATWIWGDDAGEATQSQYDGLTFWLQETGSYGGYECRRVFVNSNGGTSATQVSC